MWHRENTATAAFACLQEAELWLAKEDSSVLWRSYGLRLAAVPGRQLWSYSRMQPKALCPCAAVQVVYVRGHALESMALQCRSDPEILNTSESPYAAIAPLILIFPTVHITAVS